MKQALFLIFTIIGSINTVHPQSPSPTAQAMQRQGFTDIRNMDSTIQVSLMYAKADNFTGRILYKDLREAYLHPQAAKALVRAQKLLKNSHPELSLKVYDAARPMHIQQIMWDVVAGTPKHIYVSNPRHGGGLHNYGMAVDVTLCNAQGDTLPMGTKIDHLGKEAHINREELMIKSGALNPQALANRRLLRSVMRQAGFKPLRTEWWHFNFITRTEAKARYKTIK